MHPHREIRPLGVGRADMGRVGIAGDRRLTRPDALGWAVSPLRANAWRFAIELHELREIDIRAKGALDRF